MVSVKNLVKRYGDFCLEVSLEIPDGMVTGLIGKNGAGKSTVIKSILGLVKPDSGNVCVFGKEAGKLSPKEKEKIGAALSDSGFSNYLTLEDVTKILCKMYEDFNESEFRTLCKSQGLPFDKDLKNFSTGMKAKVKVLVALSHKADLLIMDEPTSGLDIEARNEILDIMRDYLEENERCSILITSHISSDLEGLCDDIYMIHEGKMILHEETDKIMGQYGLLKMDEAMYARLDKSNIIKTKKTDYGYECFTSEKQFYIDNYPGLVVENGNIDDLILMMTGGK